MNNKPKEITSKDITNILPDFLSFLEGKRFHVRTLFPNLKKAVIIEIDSIRVTSTDEYYIAYKDMPATVCWFNPNTAIYNLNNQLFYTIEEAEVFCAEKQKELDVINNYDKQ